MPEVGPDGRRDVGDVARVGSAARATQEPGQALDGRSVDRGGQQAATQCAPVLLLDLAQPRRTDLPPRLRDPYPGDGQHQSAHQAGMPQGQVLRDQPAGGQTHHVDRARLVGQHRGVPVRDVGRAELAVRAARDPPGPPQHGDGATRREAAHRPLVETTVHGGGGGVVEGEPGQHDEGFRPAAEAHVREAAAQRADRAHAGLASVRRRAIRRAAAITNASTTTSPASAGTRCALAPAVPLTA